MKLEKFYQKNKTTIFVVLILVGVYMVVQGPMASLRSFTESDSYKAQMDYRGGAAYAPMAEDAYYPEEERKVRQTANVNLEVETKNYNTAKLTLENLPESFDGYYTSKNEHKSTYGDKEYRTFMMTFKVPVDKFETAIDQLKKVAEMQNLYVYADDMTTEYFDTKAYLDNYLAEKEKLNELYDRAEEIEDIIKIQERLTEVQRMIDMYEMQLKNIDRVTDYSTITVTLNEKRDVIEGFYEMTSLREHWRNIVRSFDSVFVFVSNATAWVIIGGLLFLGYKGAKRLGK